jgi:hypothetical protein
VAERSKAARVENCIVAEKVELGWGKGTTGGGVCVNKMWEGGHTRTHLFIDKKGRFREPGRC